MPSATMSDVAARLGVSRAAVSYVLNGRARDRGISRQLERRILRTAQEMGYRPSKLAQSLVRQRTHTLGLILPDLGASYGPALTNALEDLARVAGYQVLLAHHRNDLERYRDTLATMLGWHVDGLAVVPLVGPDQKAAIEELEQQRIPTVLVERDIAVGHTHVVTCDVGLATRMAMEHLLGLGHRRIALLDGPHELLETRVREDTYRLLLDQAGFPFNPAYYLAPRLEESDDQTKQAETMARLLHRPDRPTSVVVISRYRALILYKVCQQLGLSIPEDLSAVVITGSLFDAFSKIQFTIAQLTYEEIGKAAFQLLRQDIEQGRGNPRRVLTSPRWIEGQSTAPPPEVSA